MDPADADFFLIPVAGGPFVSARRARSHPHSRFCILLRRIILLSAESGGGGAQVRVLQAVDFVAKQWPHFNESVRRGARTHFLPTSCDDGGFGRSAQAGPKCLLLMICLPADLGWRLMFPA